MATRNSPDLVLDIPQASAPSGRRWLALLLVGVLALLVVGGRLVFLAQRHFTAMAAMRGLGAIVDWGIDRGNYLQGGVTEVHFRGLRDQVRDEDLARISDLRGLEHLDLSGCHNITGVGVMHLARATSLRELHLDADPNNGKLKAPQLRDSDLEALKPLKQLKVLGLNGTRITDHGLEAVRELPSLEYVDLGGTQITSAGLERLRGMPRLKMVRIEGTAITLEQSAAFQRSAPNLELIDDTPANEDMVRMRRKRDY
jgi:Leucine Rich repeat